MVKKIIVTLICLFMLAAMFTACSNGTTEPSESASEAAETASATTEASAEATSEAQTTEASGELPILGAGIFSATDNFNTYIGKGITESCDGLYQTSIQDGQNDQATQMNQVDTILAKGAVGIALSVVDLTAAPTIIQKCKDAGNVPIVFFNKEITDQEVIDSYDKLYMVTSTGGGYGADIEGQMVADYWKAHPEMDKNGDGKMQVIVIMGSLEHPASQPRADYALQALTDNGIEYDLLEEETANWDTTQAKEKMDAWVSKYGDSIECVIAANDAEALGALQSVESAGFNKEGTSSEQYIPIIGIDALPEMLDKIESGEIIGSVLQDAKSQGKTIVQILDNLVNGREVTEGIDYELEMPAKAFRVPYSAITIDNLDVAKANYEK